MFRLPIRLLIPLLPIGAAIFLAAASRPPDIPFQIRMIDGGANETVAVADLNNDGRPDIISGESWYEAPNWVKHPLRQIEFNNNYVDDFTDIALDVDGDGWIDVIQFGYFSNKIVWLKNPRKTGSPWAVNEIDASGPTEFASLTPRRAGVAARSPLSHRQFSSPCTGPPARRIARSIPAARPPPSRSFPPLPSLPASSRWHHPSSSSDSLSALAVRTTHGSSHPSAPVRQSALAALAASGAFSSSASGSTILRPTSTAAASPGERSSHPHSPGVRLPALAQIVPLSLPSISGALGAALSSETSSACAAPNPVRRCECCSPSAPSS